MRTQSNDMPETYLKTLRRTGGLCLLAGGITLVLSLDTPAITLPTGWTLSLLHVDGTRELMNLKNHWVPIAVIAGLSVISTLYTRW